MDPIPPGGLVVEVGVGGRFDALAELARRRPDLELLATDVHQEALEGAPDGVHVQLDDVTDPDEALYQGACLLFAIRCPVELQIPLARVAGSVGARLALRAFKDEWADVDRVLGPHELTSTPEGAWRTWAP